MLSLIIQRADSVLSPRNWVSTVALVIAVLAGGGLLVWALKIAINTFVPDPYKPKALAVMYIVIALVFAWLIFRWAGLV